MRERREKRDALACRTFLHFAPFSHFARSPMARSLQAGSNMPSLRRAHLAAYLRKRFGPTAELLTFGRIGEETSGTALKQYGYGAPVCLTFRLGKALMQAVLETMSPGPFGHEHPADRAQALLWDYDSYGRLPRHVPALDVGAFAGNGSLFSVAPAREFFVLTEWVDGAG